MGLTNYEKHPDVLFWDSFIVTTQTIGRALENMLDDEYLDSLSPRLRHSPYTRPATHTPTEQN